MRNFIKLISVLLMVVLTLTGCMRTVDQMYRVPKRSDEFTELQTAIDSEMNGLSYCAPLTGENQQAVQSADLNGDGMQEYLLFCKSDKEHPLRVLIFKNIENAFVLVETIESNGTAFDVVEYANMDDNPGVELVFGSQLTDQLLRNVSVYTFTSDLNAERLISTNYTEFLTVNLDEDATSELFVLKSGQAETEHGIAELYSIENGKTERSNEMDMSGPADKLKRILTGMIHGDIPAVYVATTVDDSAVITDVYICRNGVLKNVTFSSESGTSVKTLRNYYVYADDIDSDGVVELPHLMPMMPMRDLSTGDRQELIRWYAMTADGEEVIKAYTFHNFIGGWYMELDSRWASQLTVVDLGNAYEFHIWDDAFEKAEKVLTVFTHSGQNREAGRSSTGQFTLYESDSIVYTAKLEAAGHKYGLTDALITSSFHLIKQAWKTGET